MTGRIAYTLKAPGLRANGALGFEKDSAWSRSDNLFSNAFAAVDWTKQLAMRTTIWKWVSLSCVAQKQAEDGSKSEVTVGINFSTGISGGVNLS